MARNKDMADIVIISPFFFDLITGVVAVIFVMFVISTGAGLERKYDPNFDSLSVIEFALNADLKSLKKTNFIFELIAKGPYTHYSVEIPANIVSSSSIINYQNQKYTIVLDIANSLHARHCFILSAIPDGDLMLGADIVVARLISNKIDSIFVPLSTESQTVCIDKKGNQYILSHNR